MRLKRGRAVYVGGADYRASYLPQTNLMVTDDWPSTGTLAKYRMSLATFKAMYVMQDGRCAICDTFKEPLSLCVDHNHVTGKVRGLLCNGCNTGLGFFKDSPDALESALQYLEERGCYGPDALKDER